MPIDPTIASGVLVPKMSFNPGAALQDIAQLQVSKLAIDEARRKSQENFEIQRLAQQFPDDPDAFVSALQHVAPERAMKFREDLENTRRLHFAGLNEQLEGEKRQYEVWGRLFQATGGDKTAYGILREGAIRQDPRLASILVPPDQLTPEALENIVSVAETSHEWLSRKQDGLKLFAEGKFREGLGSALSVAPNVEVAKGLLQEAGQDRRAKADVALFQSILQSSPDFETAKARFAEASMTPKDRADLGLKAVDDQRAAATAAETARHNRVSEAISQGNLSVALGNLNLRKQELNKPGAGKPATGAQNKTLSFFNRAKQASDEIDKLSGEISQMGLAGQTRMALAPNWAQSQTGQSYTAAQRAFTEARLRKDSGAAIPEQEFENDRQTYFVQPGDSKATIAQKTRARAAILASLAYESGPALTGFYGEDAPAMIETYKQISAGGAAAPKPSPPSGRAMAAGPREGDTKPIPGYPGTQQTYRNGKWIRTK